MMIARARGNLKESHGCGMLSAIRRNTAGGLIMVRRLVGLKSAAWVVALMTLAITARVTPAHAYTSVSVSLFYNTLSPYGRWIDYPSYGRCWVPAESRGWRPYSDGYWVYTDYGWAWETAEPFGWATYHYGRWVYDPYYGWVWVPGTEWAPAWVAWRADDDWIGWAPLPPSVEWSVAFSTGFSGREIDRIPAERWCFVGRRQFVDRDLRVRLVAPSRNAMLFRETSNMTHFDTRGGRPVNRGVDVAGIERSVGHRVPRFSVADAPRPGMGHIGHGQIAFYRPALRNAPAGRAPRTEAPLAGRGPRGNAGAVEMARHGRPADVQRIDRSTSPANRTDNRRMGRGRDQNVTVPYVPDRSHGRSQGGRPDHGRAAYAPGPERQQQQAPPETHHDFTTAGGGPRGGGPPVNMAPRGRGHSEGPANNAGPQRQDRGAPAPRDRGKGGHRDDHGGHGGD
jgi:hypothetical protein